MIFIFILKEVERDEKKEGKREDELRWHVRRNHYRNLRTREVIGILSDLKWSSQ